jgi:hypothetical protein
LIDIIWWTLLSFNNILYTVYDVLYSTFVIILSSLYLSGSKKLSDIFGVNTLWTWDSYIRYDDFRAFCNLVERHTVGN